MIGRMVNLGLAGALLLGLSACGTAKVGSDSDDPTMAKLRAIARHAAEANSGHADKAEAVKSTHSTGEKLASGGDIVQGNEPVWIVQVEGTFTCNSCSHPQGFRGTIAGHYLTITVDASTWRDTDFGIGDRRADLAKLGKVIDVTPR
ncbi:MAG: hypothetical protein M3O32_01260 [Actinomycetota bacterium]|nr:hypothetical protein [Actinomycetota bacterium]